MNRSGREFTAEPRDSWFIPDYGRAGQAADLVQEMSSANELSAVSQDKND